MPVFPVTPANGACPVVGAAVCLFCLLASTCAAALTSLLHDSEPNDAPHQAVPLRLPADKDVLRVLGSLQVQDQDAYLLVVPDEHAGRRFDLELIGRAGALTKLDIFDFTELIDARGRIPEALTAKPASVFQLATRQGIRPVVVDGLLLSPGSYVLGVSHSGGEGTYELKLSQNDNQRIQVVDGDEGTDEAPVKVSNRGRTTLFAAAETVYAVEIPESGDEQPVYWDIAFQLPAGRKGSLRLENANDETLLEIEDGNGREVRRRGLALPPGPYSLITDAGDASVQMITVETGAPVAGGNAEVEPNDRQPNAIAFFRDLTGRFEAGDNDRFVFEVGEAQAGRKFTIQLRAEPGSKPELCLKRDAIGLSECYRATGDGVAGFADVVLPAGLYELNLNHRTDPAVDWALTWTEQGEARPGEEAELNNVQRMATQLHERGFGRGRFLGRETDWWRFSVDGEPQLWRLQLQGDDLHELALHDSTGQVKRVRPGAANRARLDNVFLLPGNYFLAASGTDSGYTLRVLSLGPPPTGMEMEPNDDYHDAMPIRFGQQYTGTLAESDDVDRYSFLLMGEELVRIRIQPPADGAIQGYVTLGDESVAISDIRNGSKPGAPLEWDLYLPPGDYGVQLDAGQASDAEYTLVVERGDWLEPAVDREPNDWRETAVAFPADGIVRGRVGITARSQDWYRLPAQPEAVPLSFPRVSGRSLELFAEGSDENLLTWSHEAQLEQAELAAGVVHHLMIRGNAEYELDLSALVVEAPPSGFPGIAVEVEVEPVQAYSRWEQAVQGTLTLRNPNAVEVPVTLVAHLTDARWRFQPRAAIPSSIAAGAEIAVPFELRVPPDVADWAPVRLSLAGGDHPDAPRTGAEIAVDADAAPLRPTFHWPLPEALRGGFNAASLALGAEPVPSPGVPDKSFEDMSRLFDSLARVGRWTEFKVPFNRGQDIDLGRPTVRLAGDAPVPVRGFMIDPTASLSPVSFLHDFAVELSGDGQRFERVLEGTLQPMPMEQAFVLDEPVEARFARLIPLSTAFSSPSNWGMRIGEFKVVAEPGWRPTDGPVNIADPAFGGHLVWGRPWVPGSTTDRSMLTEDGDAVRLDLRRRGDEDGEIVLGFQHARAARIDAVSLLKMVDAPPDEQPSMVTVGVSRVSPIGPWQTVGEFELVDDETRFDLADPVWARYVRFGFSGQESQRSLRVPDRIAVFEHIVQASDPSILGEWGHYDWRGPFEAAEPPRFPGLAGEPDNLSRASARVVVAGAPAPGRALLDAYAAWYRLEVPEGMNRLVLRMAGDPTLEAAPRLTDADGERVPIYPLKQEPDGHRWEAYLEPGAVYWLEAYEPPRSVIFSWDTSGSVAAYLPVISNALFNYARTIKPGRDEVNLLPFGHREPLLANWVGHPYPLQRLLAAYPQDTSSSDAEGTLAAAARAMVGRPGKKAVILLTDAATSTDSALWPSLTEGEPQVFSMALSMEGAFGGSPISAQDYMQDWAMVRGGEYQYVTSLALLQMAFDRTVARLKRPVDFEVEVAFETVEDPEPATIAVTAATGGDPMAHGAVEIILDASGSMLQRMGGIRRIEVAKDAIRRTVDEALPDGIPLALRVYGHREAGVCRTDLEVPLAPLDKSAFLEKVDAIQAINLAKTPIAASLDAAAADLTGAEGRRLVILLTDGEETCEGDPAAAIQGLADSGIKLRLNIVGFAIDDTELKQQFRDWAELGGGEYLDAGESGELEAAMRQALRVPFRVIDAAGETAAAGFADGDPVQVPPGEYTVVIERVDGEISETIGVAPGDAGLIELN